MSVFSNVSAFVPFVYVSQAVQVLGVAVGLVLLFNVISMPQFLLMVQMGSKVIFNCKVTQKPSQKFFK